MPTGCSRSILLLLLCHTMSKREKCSAILPCRCRLKQGLPNWASKLQAVTFRILPKRYSHITPLTACLNKDAQTETD